MKITHTTHLFSTPQNPPVLPKKLPHRKHTRRKTARTPRLLGKKERAGPPTPLFRWKFEDAPTNADVEDSPESRRKVRKGKAVAGVSARKLAAGLWRLQSAGVADGAEEERMKRGDGLGFKVCFNLLFESQDLNLGLFKPRPVHTGDRISCHHGSRGCGSEAIDPLRSPCSVNGPINRYRCETQSPLRFSNYAMEGVTKWDPVCSKASNEDPVDIKALDQKLNSSPMISALQAELEQARARIEELESERRSSKKKLEHFLRKLSEERAAWRSREHEKVRAIIDDVKSDLNRERKNRQRLEIVNSKLVNELAEAKLSAKRFMQDYEKERKAKELIEEVCNELAKEIGEDKAEIETLKKECLKVRDEMEEERKMLQMAEVWREERVQMKLIDAKVTLENKYLEMKKLVTELESFLRSRGATLDTNNIREAETLRSAAASVNIQDIKEFMYDPPNPDDIFSVFEEMAMGDANEREIEPCVVYSPESHGSKDDSSLNKDRIHRVSNLYVEEDDNVEDDGSGWETVSNAEDQGSSYSLEGSVMSVNKMHRDSEVFEGNETPITEISEVCSVPLKQPKKVPSISKLWRSYPNNNGENLKVVSLDGMNGRLSNGRISNGAVMSPDRGSDMAGWSSPDSMNPRVSRGMKGCIEWPRGIHKNSLKQKLLEARMESQKIQLRQVLKQKI